MKKAGQNWQTWYVILELKRGMKIINKNSEHKLLLDTEKNTFLEVHKQFKGKALAHLFLVHTYMITFLTSKLYIFSYTRVIFMEIII